MVVSNALALKTKSILFVDDDDIIRDNLYESLSIIFDKVYVANNGKDGFEMYEDYKPDIVFTDIQMPLLDGIQMASKIRKNDFKTPIIFYSAYNEQKYLLEAINLLSEGYLIKPATLNELIKAFSNAIMKSSNTVSNIINFNNGITYNQHTKELMQNENKIQLTPKEILFLDLMINKYPTIVTKEIASSEIWPLETITQSAMKNIVARLRDKIGQDIIVSIKGVGWRLSV